MGVMGEEKLKEYGGRLVRVIKQFVEANGLEDYVANRPGKRTRNDDVPVKVSAVVVPTASSIARAGQAKARKAVIEIVDDDDEFETDIDFATIEIP